ncbi:hypothetical protein Tco_1523412 [Tanacetum coccineum]
MENSNVGSNSHVDMLRLIKSPRLPLPLTELKCMQRHISVPMGLRLWVLFCYAVRLYTRPDVAFDSTIKPIPNRYQFHGSDLKRVLRVSCYTDAGYLTDADDSSLRPGIFFFCVFVLNGGAVDQKSAKQKHLRIHPVEAEFIAASVHASKEAVWVRKFISGLGVVPTIEKPINMLL